MRVRICSQALSTLDGLMTTATNNIIITDSGSKRETSLTNLPFRSLSSTTEHTHITRHQTLLAYVINNITINDNLSYSHRTSWLATNRYG